MQKQFKFAFRLLGMIVISSRQTSMKYTNSDAIRKIEIERKLRILVPAKKTELISSSKRHMCE
jgi:hypothetical protein